MSTKLIKKQLGDILYKNLYVPRVTKKRGSDEPHIMTYKHDTKDGKHRAGDIRMKHPSNIKEIQYWFATKDEKNNDVDGKIFLDMVTRSFIKSMYTTGATRLSRIMKASRSSDDGNDDESHVK